MSAGPKVAYIGLGSNLENPTRQLCRAFDELDALPKTRLAATSSLYGSAPLGPPDQPDYVNAVARLVTDLSPLDLLDALQAIEQAHDRVRLQHWGPRTLDLDILLYDDAVIASERLSVPHPEMHKRAFVLVPLAEIAPQLALPGVGVLKDLLLTVDDSDLHRLSGCSDG